MQNQQNKIKVSKKTIVIISFILLIGIIILSTIFFILEKQKTASLEVLIAPSKATIKINSKEYKSFGTIRLKPGEYSVNISSDGFISQQTSVSLTENQTEKLYVILEPLPENQDWYNQHPSDSNIVNIISDYYSNLSLQEYRNKYPIVNILPILVVEVDKTTYDWVEYRIDYGKFDGCTSDFCLKITDSTGGNYDKALDKIKSSGYDPTQYQILYEYTPVEAI